MNLLTIIEELVVEGELIDASAESQAVFGSGILAVITKNLSETLADVDLGRPQNGNSMTEELFLDIKQAFGKQWCMENISNIRDFLSQGKQAVVPVLELPDFLVVVVPLPTILTLFICERDEAPEQFGIRI